MTRRRASTHFRKGHDPRRNTKQTWKPGQPGNPQGHSRKRRLATLLESMLDERIADPAIAAIVKQATGKETWEAAVLHAMRREAAKGNVQMIREVLDRVDGKVPIPIGDVTGKPLATGAIIVEIGKRTTEQSDDE